MQMGSKKTDENARQNPIWQMLNDPEFSNKCTTRDPVTLARLRGYSAMSPEELGRLWEHALENTSDQRAGKFFRTLVRNLANEAFGEAMQVMLYHCRCVNDAQQALSKTG